MHIIRALVVAAVLLGGYVGPNSGEYLTPPATVVAAILLVWEMARHLPRIHPVVPFIIIVFATLSVHRLFSQPALEYGEQKFYSFLSVVLFSAAIAALVTMPRGFMALTVIWVAMSLYLSGVSLLNDDSLRADVFGMNPIWVARIIAAGAVLLIWLYWNKRIRLLSFGIIGIILLLGIFATGSRGPLVASLSGAAVIILASKLSVDKKILILIFGSVCTFILLRLPVFNESRIVGIMTGEIDGGTARARMWEQSFRAVVDHPLGVGYGNWALHTDGFRGFYPHNLFLEVFVEQGLLVGLFFVILVSVILVRCMRAARYSPEALGVSAWLVAEIIHVSVSGDLKAPIFFFVLTLAFLVTRYAGGLEAEGKPVIVSKFRKSQVNGRS